MGYALRTKSQRYVEWREWKSGEIVAQELYDHSGDSIEMLNLADEKRDLVTSLSAMLRAGWKHALPTMTPKALR